MTIKPRARDIGLIFAGDPGTNNAITDVPGLTVGTSTVVEAAQPGIHKGLCTGVTAIIPRGESGAIEPVWAGLSSFNGNGELTGGHHINDLGWFLGPVMITNSHSVGIVHHATVGWMIDRYKDVFKSDHMWCLPVVGETYDGVLNDINARGVTEAHAIGALNAAVTGPVPEGNTGGGTGMIAYEFKGGTGTASRQLDIAGQGYTLGVLVQANHGSRDDLQVSGFPVGQQMRDNLVHPRETGSIIVVIATDAPLLPHQLNRVARRGAIGIGRNGTSGGHSSGDIFLAFSTANPQSNPWHAPDVMDLRALKDTHLDAIYQATVQAIEEAVLNAMIAADSCTAVKPQGQLVAAIDHDHLCRLLATGPAF
ncbi:P1 family peptidase [Sulfitobacter mediterraneus]|uniref:DmpA family aminopeptidase n=1 Tax=Sulfitobacter mediterraneus TaxID=83219 RepID=UPI00193390CB|nr:P1 family peptidase [Sulfitobacter mediterraneus]MBM1635181.1 P1 family peptidase [Sulfitobacter mediterraneus]MBM1643032.1 P1 family peptidase [Sulfitobacter mediterraneus]MBM1647080.1 P1 family peptidase [Sulfitobacter mediterraneus]MBM1651122.1 P1 family peptidase [Sulfitobacter mediterraneus]MBM1655151.1 P1 family peptidase [Sulfitobacter mediterraneus]